MVNALAKGYGIELFDYQRESNGLLVSSGAGTMCAVMDVCPVFRWCLDIDQNTDADRLGSFLICADVCVNPFGVVGWFSITPPEPLQDALRRLPNLGRVLAYTQQATMPAGFHFSTLGDFIAAANDFETLTANVLVDKGHWSSRGSSSGKRIDTSGTSFKFDADEKDFVSDPEALTVRADCQRREDDRISRAKALLGEAIARSPV